VLTRASARCWEMKPSCAIEMKVIARDIAAVKQKVVNLGRHQKQSLCMRGQLWLVIACVTPYQLLDIAKPARCPARIVDRRNLATETESSALA